MNPVDDAQRIEYLTSPEMKEYVEKTRGIPWTKDRIDKYIHYFDLDFDSIAHVTQDEPDLDGIRGRWFALEYIKKQKEFVYQGVKHCSQFKEFNAFFVELLKDSETSSIKFDDALTDCLVDNDLIRIKNFRSFWNRPIVKHYFKERFDKK